MEEELRCPVCKQLYNNPVLLPCYHALCLNCAVHLQQPVSHAGPGAAAAASAEPAESVASGSSSTEPGDYQEVDKLSILSETDSGVVCTSRPNSYVGTPNLQGLLFPPLSTSALSLACPVCHKLVYFDENGAHNLHKYRVMQAIVDKYGETRDALRCEMCEGEPAPATTACEQCAVLYCDACREACHPARGPLAKHTLHEPRRGLALAAAGGRRGGGALGCPDHEDETLSMYCLVCKQAVCALCLHDTRHTSHDVQAIAAMCKAQKVNIEVVRCEVKDAPDTCEKYSTLYSPLNICKIISINEFGIAKTFDSIHPPVHCPVKKVNIEVVRCEVKDAPDTCEKYTTLHPPMHVCKIILVSELGILKAVNSFHPPIRCPVKKLFNIGAKMVIVNRFDVCYIPKNPPYKVHYFDLKPLPDHNYSLSASGEILEDLHANDLDANLEIVRCEVKDAPDTCEKYTTLHPPMNVCKIIFVNELGIAKAINSIHPPIRCPVKKTELSQNLQQLSEKARSTTEFIQRLKGMSDKINENCSEFEAVVSAQCDALIDAIHARRAQLVDCIRQDKEMRVRALKEQVALCTSRLQHTTGLLQFCIEALKESDSAAFLQVGSMLITRVANTDITWNKELQVNAPRVSPHFDLTLDDKSVLRAINQLNFIQMKPPAAPTIIPEECSAENNSVTVAWQPPPQSHVEGYVLELDDGNGGDFREVYCGVETICTVDGLHFHCMYNARVKAFNSSGEGEYSELIGLQTAEVAWFTFDPLLTGPGLQYSEDSLSVSGEGWEHRVALGSVGFSRGVHYWEISIDKFDADTDPAFGIARIDVARDKMLGKDDKGWAMYIDRQRSWFQHAGTHEQRVEGGVSAGGTIGVLLDLDRHQLSFYVNEEPQGGVAFRNLYGVFYPAVSVNRGVSVSLHTALDAPSDSDDT